MMTTHTRVTIEPLQVRITEAAKLLGYSEATIYRMLDRGDIKSIGHGRLRRIPVTELRRWQTEEWEHVHGESSG